MALDRTRYEELLGRALDGELSAEAGAEFARLLAADAGLREDFRRHLALWDLWSQEQAPERSASAFLAAWQTRLAAEAGAEAFGERVRLRLERELPVAGPAGRIRRGLDRWAAAVRRPIGLAWTAAASAAVVAAVLWLAQPRAAQATVTLRGEAVCTACVLHQTHQCSAALRVTEHGVTRIYHLEPSHDISSRQGTFCRGPTPAVVTGHLATDGDRLLFEASSLELPARPKPPPRDERILFPL